MGSISCDNWPDISKRRKLHIHHLSTHGTIISKQVFTVQAEHHQQQDNKTFKHLRLSSESFGCRRILRQHPEK
ncbi:MAG: hypothetical protein D3906_14280 [Candidatus Electrothrix sp. AUS1_2]|nr:hypothetical protein [Candidatus Electrothrix sp. AUS1_2]